MNTVKRILITNHFLRDFTGSEIATLDLAKEFLRLGFNVTVGTFVFQYPLKNEFEKLKIKVVDLSEFQAEHFDIIWAHHFTTLDTCIIDKDITAHKIIFSSLSPYEPLESPPLSFDKVNMFLANSIETKKTLMEMGIDSENIAVFPNPINNEFFENVYGRRHHSPKNIAIVSNHVPQEVKEAATILNDRGFNVKVFGIEGEFTLITPTILQNYDAVITIGRTVQYCLAMGIPVYCYDRFGGPGWLTPSNIDLAAEFNFSGRCTQFKKTAEGIVREILEFDSTTILSDFYREYAQQKYRLDVLVQKILGTVDFDDSHHSISEKLYQEIAFRQRKYTLDAISHMQWEIDSLKSNIAGRDTQLAERDAQLAERDAQLAERDAQLAERNAQLHEITVSKAWRMVLSLRKLRIFLIPPGSRREAWALSSLRAAAYIRRNGLLRSLERAVKYLNEPSSMNPAPNKEQFSFLLSDGVICSMPAISIIIEMPSDYEQLQFTEMDLIAWLEGQSFNDAEIVIWDRKTNLVTMVSENEISWEAKDMEALCQNLVGKYICMASPDLLERNHTYLEANLLALETEDLIFTINLIGKSHRLFENIGDGNLPSNCDFPYQRQFIRRDCIRNGFMIDINDHLDGRENQPVVVGKIIEHTSSVSDAITMIPANIDLTINMKWALDGHYVIAKNKNEISSWERIEHAIHPINTVLPLNKDISHLPTVLVFMPFLAVGGAERLMLKLIQELKDKIRFIVVTVEEMDATLGTTTDLFFKEIPHVYTLADYLQPRLYFSFLSYLIEKFEVQSFYIANGSNWIYDCLLMLRQKHPTIRIVNQVYDHQFGWINRYDNKIAAAIDAHISANPKISQAYLKYGVQSEQIHFVEHAVDINEINPDDYPLPRRIEIKNKLGLPVTKKIVAFCARLHPQKRPLDFIEMARRLDSEEMIHFLMVGDGPLALAVEEQVKRTGLRNFTRIPFYSPISDIYAIADVFVLPSEYEAMPLVVLEALAMGKPVVATDVGHIRDVLEMTNGGIVVPSISDISAFRTGVLRSLEKKFDSALMRHEISQRFGLSVIAKKYFSVWLGEQDA